MKARFVSGFSLPRDNIQENNEAENREEETNGDTGGDRAARVDEGREARKEGSKDEKWRRRLENWDPLARRWSEAAISRNKKVCLIIHAILFPCYLLYVLYQKTLLQLATFDEKISN